MPSIDFEAAFDLPFREPIRRIFDAACRAARQGSVPATAKEVLRLALKEAHHRQKRVGAWDEEAPDFYAGLVADLECPADEVWGYVAHRMHQSGLLTTNPPIATAPQSTAQPMTKPQKRYIRRLGYTGTPHADMHEANLLIRELKTQRRRDRGWKR